MKKLLIIDDEKNVRLAIKRLVKENIPEVDVIEIGSCTDLTGLIQKSRPRLILLDLLMPDMNGLQLLKTIKRSGDRLIRRIPVIILTGVANKEVMFKAQAMGVADYITKPFNPKVLVRKIKKYVS